MQVLRKNKRTFVFTSLALALFACHPTKQEISSTKALSSGTYIIKSRMSGKCLDVDKASNADGLILQQWDCLNNDAQKFRVASTDSGFVRITNVASNKDLDARERGTADGTPIQQWGYGGGTNQQWRLSPREAGAYAIIGRASGRALDVKDKSNANGAKIQLWQDYSTTNQQWFFQAVGDGRQPPPTPTPSPNPGPNPPPANGGVTIKVTNQCPFNIWIHAQGVQGVLQPDHAQISPKSSRSYTAPGLWQSGRVEAYVGGPNKDQLEKVEMTFDKTPQGEQALNYNITYVDWVGLPVQVSSIGTGGDCKPAGCSRPVAQLLDGCPAGLKEGNRCWSERSYCLNPANAGKPICTKFESKIAECANKYADCRGAAGSKTPEVQACSGAFFSQNPKYCAAINRGMLDDPMNANIGLYYKKGPYNEYSKWVHDVCPGIYALAYDDFPPAANESGYHSCTGGRQLDITFCPGG